jgi:TctA family transporter
MNYQKNRNALIVSLVLLKKISRNIRTGSYKLMGDFYKNAIAGFAAVLKIWIYLCATSADLIIMTTGIYNKHKIWC